MTKWLRLLLDILLHRVVYCAEKKFTPITAYVPTALLKLTL